MARPKGKITHAAARWAWRLTVAGSGMLALVVVAFWVRANHQYTEFRVDLSHGTDTELVRHDIHVYAFLSGLRVTNYRIRYGERQRRHLSTGNGWTARSDNFASFFTDFFNAAPEGPIITGPLRTTATGIPHERFNFLGNRFAAGSTTLKPDGSRLTIPTVIEPAWWLLTVLAAAPFLFNTALLTRRLVRSIMKHTQHPCSGCGYELQGLPGGSPCPECGATG